MPLNNSTVGDLALLQFDGWMTGEASTRRLIPLAELAASDLWVLYESGNTMSDHFYRVDDSRNDAITAELLRRPVQ